MDDDDGRIHAALVRIPQLGSVHAGFLGRLKLHRFQQQARQHRRGHLAVRRSVRLCNRVPHRAQTLALGGRDQVQSGKFQKPQPGFKRTLDQLALVFVHRIPLVHGNHHGPSGLQDIARNMGVLVRDTLNGIDQQQHDVGRLNRLQRFDH